MKTKDFLKESDWEEYNDEAGMIDSNIETIKRTAQELDDLLKSDDNMAEWAQEKLAVAKDMLVRIKDYIASEKARGVMPKVAETASAGATGAGSLAISMGGGAGFGKSIFMSRQGPKTKKVKNK